MNQLEKIIENFRIKNTNTDIIFLYLNQEHEIKIGYVIDEEKIGIFLNRVKVKTIISNWLRDLEEYKEKNDKEKNIIYYKLMSTYTNIKKKLEKEGSYIIIESDDLKIFKHYEHKKINTGQILLFD